MADKKLSFSFQSFKSLLGKSVDALGYMWWRYLVVMATQYVLFGVIFAVIVVSAGAATGLMSEESVTALVAGGTDVNDYLIQNVLQLSVAGIILLAGLIWAGLLIGVSTVLLMKNYVNKTKENVFHVIFKTAPKYIGKLFIVQLRVMWPILALMAVLIVYAALSAFMAELSVGQVIMNYVLGLAGLIFLILGIIRAIRYMFANSAIIMYDAPSITKNMASARAIMQGNTWGVIKFALFFVLFALIVGFVFGFAGAFLDSIAGLPVLYIDAQGNPVGIIEQIVSIALNVLMGSIGLAFFIQMMDDLKNKKSISF